MPFAGHNLLAQCSCMKCKSSKSIYRLKESRKASNNSLMRLGSNHVTLQHLEVRPRGILSSVQESSLNSQPPVIFY